MESLKTPSFRNPKDNDPYGINVGGSSPFGATSTPSSAFKTSATGAFGSPNNGAGFGSQATMNPAATPAKQFDITRTPLFQAQQAATMQQLDPNAPLAGFDPQANIARDAQKVAQMQSAQAVRNQLIGQGLKDSGQYLTQGIIGPADQATRQRADLERSLAATREQMLQARTAQGQQVAGQMTSQQLQQAEAEKARQASLQSQMLGQQFTGTEAEKQRATQLQSQMLGQDFSSAEAQKQRDWQTGSQVMAQGFQASETDKNQAWQTSMQTMQNAFSEKGMNFNALMQSLDSLPDEQVADVLNQVASSMGITHPIFDENGQQVGTAPGLQNYKDVYASKAIKTLNTYDPGKNIDNIKTMSSAQKQQISDGWDTLKSMGNNKIAQPFNAAIGTNLNEKMKWVTDNAGKLIKADDGNIYVVDYNLNWNKDITGVDVTSGKRITFNKATGVLIETE